ncbi:C-x8-C-x5-C-x3-H type zinc finger protein [Polychaeton citri CBS 116435]|uniref:C-x8-C-x5-C-x3-H type zinc finger protein n=1 Tax=Polychaeton citri CBS 116435 TaxID=1314669 RepID=A0A9P4QA70_9PEZI|nr:C-x8-C-x5-C-x3-H type zinc finger protein [Polychaeton citri CBS 116435]
MTAQIATAVSGYLDRLDSFRQADRDREAMVTELVQAFEDLQGRYTKKCDDYENEIESRRMWQAKARGLELSLNDQKITSSANSFITVLIDGDGAVFQDSLLAMAKDGGAEAAHQLMTEIKNQIKSTYPDASPSEWNIFVQVFLNMQGLGSKLLSCGVISRLADLSGFAAAFSLAQPLFSLVDVGSGKERADHKVRETLRLFLPMSNCRHVFFGPCHDNGYLPFLEQYKRDSLGSKITLIETLPAEHGFEELNMKRVRFPGVFRSDNLPAKPTTNGFASSPVAHPAMLSSSSIPARSGSIPLSAPSAAPKSVSPAPSNGSGTVDTGSWAAVGKTYGTQKSISIAPSKKKRRFILQNVHGERVDEELPRPDPTAATRFNKRVHEKGNYCNNFHLKGACETGPYCDYQHGEKLLPSEKLILLRKARGLVCIFGSDCVEPDCMSGHHCQYGPRCAGSSCRFYDYHGIEMEPAKRVFDDGTEELLPEYLSRHKSR